MGKYNVFKYKIIALLFVSFIGILFFVYFNFPSSNEGEFFERLYYTVFLYPIVLGAMLVGIPVSFLADYVINKMKKENRLNSAFAHTVLCILVFLLPYILINKELNIFAFFYFVIIPFIYSLINTSLIKKKIN